MFVLTRIARLTQIGGHSGEEDDLFNYVLLTLSPIESGRVNHGFVRNVTAEEYPVSGEPELNGPTCIEFSRKVRTLEEAPRSGEPEFTVETSIEAEFSRFVVLPFLLVLLLLILDAYSNPAASVADFASAGLDWGFAAVGVEPAGATP